MTPATGDDDGAHRGLSVRCASPAEGRTGIGREGPLRVDGREVAIAGYPRMSDRWVEAPDRASVFALADDEGTRALDLLAGTRSPI